MNEVLLSSVKLCKGIGGIADNVADEYILTALREAQDMRLQRVLGTRLLDKCKALIESGEIDDEENAVYKELVKGAQYFLTYTALAAVCVKTSFKVSNFGVVQTSDEHVSPAAFTDVMSIRDDWQNKADAYCKGVQRFILRHRAQLPEVDACQCDEIRAHLFDAATCGLWLGGQRGIL